MEGKSLITKLRDLEMIQGTSFNIRMNCMNRGSTENAVEIPDLTNYELWFVLYNYGQETTPVFIKKLNAISGTTNSFRLNLSTLETKDWQGVYTMEFILKDCLNNTLEKNARGIVKVAKSGINILE